MRWTDRPNTGWESGEFKLRIIFSITLNCEAQVDRGAGGQARQKAVANIAPDRDSRGRHFRLGRALGMWLRSCHQDVTDIPWE